MRAPRSAKLLALLAAATTVLGIGLVAEVAGASSAEGMARHELASAAQGFPASTPPLFQATICAGRGVSCQWIGTSQVALWATLALSEPRVVSLMAELAIEANTGAPIEVSTTDNTNSGVIVRLHVRSSSGVATRISPLASFLTIAFDNSMDRSAASTGVRLGSLRDVRYGPPQPGTITTVIAVDATKVVAGSIHLKTMTMPTVSPDLWSMLNQDTIEVIPAGENGPGLRTSPGTDSADLQRLPISALTAEERRDQLHQNLRNSQFILQAHIDHLTFLHSHVPGFHDQAELVMCNRLMAIITDNIASARTLIAHLNLLLIQSFFDE